MSVYVPRCMCGGDRRFVSLTLDEENRTLFGYALAAVVCISCGMRGVISEPTGSPPLVMWKRGDDVHEHRWELPVPNLAGNTNRGEIRARRDDATKPTEAELAASIARIGAVR